jgi:membrane associated rhomboid family serine protease
MGIYDRDYYRDDRRNPIDTILGEGHVCKFLVLATAACFLFPFFLPNGMAADFYGALDLEPVKLLHGQVWRLVTFLFLHPAQIWSLVWTLLFLWWFGSDLEQLYGSAEFLVFYLLTGILSGLGFVGWAYASEVADGVRMLGPAGAISGMLVLFALHFPSYKMRIWMLPVPIWVVVLVQVAGNVTLTWSHGDILAVGAFAMNLTGALFGALYYKKQWRLSSMWPNLREKAPARVKVRTRPAQTQLEEEPVAVAAPSDVDEHLEAKVDAVLEKMGRSGKESLTSAEREILLRASAIYRKKRT